MELTTQEVILRYLKPKENMALHKIGTKEVPTPDYAPAESGEPQ